MAGDLEGKGVSLFFSLSFSAFLFLIFLFLIYQDNSDRTALVFVSRAYTFAFYIPWGRSFPFLFYLFIACRPRDDGLWSEGLVRILLVNGPFSSGIAGLWLDAMEGFF